MAKETQKELKAAENTAAKAEPVLRKGQGPEQEAVYSVSELAANAKELFKTRPECISAAMKNAGKTKCTVSEAREIVGKFLKREVQ